MKYSEYLQLCEIYESNGKDLFDELMFINEADDEKSPDDIKIKNPKDVLSFIYRPRFAILRKKFTSIAKKAQEDTIKNIIEKHLPSIIQNEYKVLAELSKTIGEFKQNKLKANESLNEDDKTNPQNAQTNPQNTKTNKNMNTDTDVKLSDSDLKQIMKSFEEKIKNVKDAINEEYDTIKEGINEYLENVTEKVNLKIEKSKLTPTNKINIKSYWIVLKTQLKVNLLKYLQDSISNNMQNALKKNILLQKLWKNSTIAKSDILNLNRLNQDKKSFIDEMTEDIQKMSESESTESEKTEKTAEREE